MLSWSLIVCTINRREVLEQSLGTAINQTRLPKQIIVVDASDDWEFSKTRILDSLARDYKSIEWIYVDSEQKSLTYQRNAGFKFCKSDVVFFLDDDSFMYPNCAEEIMQVYENDKFQRVGGVSAILAITPPQTLLNNDQNERKIEPPSKWKPSLAPMYKLWYQDQLFIPYDGKYHTHDISELASRSSVVSEVLFHGCRMTYRTSVVKEVGGFDEVLIRGAIAEDSDISYRVSRKYALVIATQARIFHEQTKIARINSYKNSMMVILNIVVLFLLNTKGDNEVSFLIYRHVIWRLLLELIRDSAKPQQGFPHVRGVFQAILYLPKILQMNKNQLRRWYPQFQAHILDKKQSIPVLKQSIPVLK